nr:AAA family ATPase [Acidobacteriota bacterium]
DEFRDERHPAAVSVWGDGLIVKGGAYMILGGDTGVGKTILAANKALAMAEGRDEFLGFQLPGRPVCQLFLEGEGSRPRFRDRFVRAAENLGVSTSGLPIFFHEISAPLSIESGSLSRMIEQSGAEVVFLDPIGRFYSGNENLTDDWRAMVTAPLAKLASDHCAAFVLSDHYSKPNEARSGQHKIRGSAAKVQDCGAALRLEIGRAGGGSRILFFDRVRDGALPFPERDPSRMPLVIDVAKGTISRDEREDEEGLLASREARVADVVETVRAAGTEIRTSDLVAGLNTLTGLEKSRANDLIASAVACRAIERARRGVYRLPGELLGSPA